MVLRTAKKGAMPDQNFGDARLSRVHGNEGDEGDECDESDEIDEGYDGDEGDDGVSSKGLRDINGRGCSPAKMNYVEIRHSINTK